MGNTINPGAQVSADCVGITDRQTICAVHVAGTYVSAGGIDGRFLGTVTEQEVPVEGAAVVRATGGYYKGTVRQQAKGQLIFTPSTVQLSVSDLSDAPLYDSGE